MNCPGADPPPGRGGSQPLLPSTWRKSQVKPQCSSEAPGRTEPHPCREGQGSECLRAGAQPAMVLDSFPVYQCFRVFSVQGKGHRPFIIDNKAKLLFKGHVLQFKTLWVAEAGHRGPCSVGFHLGEMPRRGRSTDRGLLAGAGEGKEQ